MGIELAEGRKIETQVFTEREANLKRWICSQDIEVSTPGIQVVLEDRCVEGEVKNWWWAESQNKE